MTFFLYLIDYNLFGDKMNSILEKEDINIENMIYEIRGKQVMLDSDLAKLYHCKNGTKDINKAVKRNIERFPDNFYFQLTDYERKELWFQIGTTNNMTRSNPHVFTEQGVAMLSSVLHSDIAIDTSIKIMNAFVSMRHYIGNNDQRFLNIETKLLEHDSDIKLLQESFNKLEEKRKINEIYFNGQIFDAYSKIFEIFKEAKNSLIIVDNYADNTILNIIKRLDVKVTIITKKNNLLTEQDIEKYNKQYHNLNVIYNNTFHDRYYILDNETFYHCGASINRIGYKTFSITQINDKEICNALLKNIKKNRNY